MTTIRCKHSGNSGDIIHSLPCIYQLMKRMNAKECKYLLEVGVEAQYSPDLAHPMGDVLLNDDCAKKMIPLLESQGFQADLWDYLDVDFNLSLFRELDWDMGRGDLRRLYGYVFKVQLDLSQPYLDVVANPVFKDVLLVNRTNRYHGRINYRFLRRYPCVFIGLMSERNAFCEEFDLDMPCFEFANFLELAQAIKGAKALIANQSLCFAIAEALKTPRALEVYREAPNVVPTGKYCWDYYTQNLAEGIVKQLAGTV